MKAKEFDKKFDEGKDISKYLDISKARRPEQEVLDCGTCRKVCNFVIEKEINCL